MLVTCARNLCIRFGYELYFQKAIPILAKMMNGHLIIIRNWHLIMIMFWIGSGAEVLRRKFLIWSSYPFLNSFFLHTFHLTKFESVSWSFTLHSIKSFSEMINEIVGCFMNIELWLLFSYFVSTYHICIEYFSFW